MTRDSGPESGAKGVVEDIKGKAKEVVGEVTGDESKEREGRAQQDKAVWHPHRHPTRLRRHSNHPMCRCGFER